MDICTSDDQHTLTLAMDPFPVDKDQIPTDPSLYRSQEYWEWRYAHQEREKTYDWFAKHADIRPLLPSIPATHAVLVLGCGNSSFSADLVDCHQCTVMSVDYSAAVIRSMAHMHADNERLQWKVGDIRSLPFPDCSFDLVIDKATLDALWSDGGSPWHPSAQVVHDVSRTVAQAFRCLKAGGQFLSVSLGQPHFRKALLSGSAPWQPECSIQQHSLYYLYLFTRPRL